MKIKVGILDSDSIYLSRLVRYFSTYYIDKVDIFGFHEPEKFREFLRQTRIDVLLAEPELVPDDLELPKTMIMAYLSETSDAKSLDGIKVVGKYQRVGMLYKEILGLYAELDKKTIFKESDGAGTVLFFMGISGGVGTTTAAVACAQSLASFGKNVLYLNLEENGVVAPFLQGDGNATMSEVLYAVKSGQSNLALKLESMVRKSSSNVFFYEPCSVNLDAQEMEKSDLTTILDTVIRYLSYDFIVIDAGADVLWKRNTVIDYATYLFMVSDGKEISRRKLERTLQEFTIRDKNEEARSMSKVRVLYNRCTRDSVTDVTEYQESVFGTVEELSGSTPGDVAGKIAQRPLFERLL